MPRPEAHHAPSERKVILVAEDADDLREMYRVWMELADLQMIEASDGLRAVELARQHQPDAILMDLSMPRLDGWEACRQLKADISTRHIPIIAISAHGYPDAQRRAIEAGCDHFIAKPCTPDRLEMCLRELWSSPTG